MPTLWPEFAASGCVFVVSAFESVDDAVLERLDKGHTAADAARAVTILRDAGIEVRPSWLPFTPWTTRDDLVALLDFVHDHDLVGSIDPVQYSVRLLAARRLTPARPPRSDRLRRPVGRRTLDLHLGVTRSRRSTPCSSSIAAIVDS